MVEGFYSWYAGMINRKRLNQEFNPKFVKDKTGMTTLDFTNYRAGLSKHGFTEDLIKRRINFYKPCLDNLKTIPYDSFIKFELDGHEQIGCNFSNTYEWIGGLEPVIGAELIKLNRRDNNTIDSTVRFYAKAPDGVKIYSGSASMLLRKFKAGWMISDVK